MLWQQNEKDAARPQQYAAVVQPELCPAKFMSDTLLVEIGPAVDDIPQVDAVSLSGHKTDAVPNVLDLSETVAIEYVPTEYFSGNDSFEYVINRCSYASQNRIFGLAPATVSFIVTPVNQRPRAKTKQLLFDFANVTIWQPTYAPEVEFDFPVSDIETRDLTVTILSLPAAGYLVRKTSRTSRIAVGDTILSSEPLVYVGRGCRDVDATQGAQAFQYKVSDGQLESEIGTMTLVIDCVGNIARVSKAVEALLFAVTTVSVVVIVVAMVLIVVWRERRSIRKSSPLFCLLILFGAVLSSISPIFLTPSLMNCTAFISFLTIGCVLFFANLAVKTYRVDRIFNTSGFTVFVVSNAELLRTTIALVLLQVIALVVWGTSVDLKPSLVPVNGGFVFMCYSPYWPTVIGVEYSFLGLLFVFTAVFAWRVRSIPISEYKESKEIFLAVRLFCLHWQR
eukprot:TRINITY_DN2084_c0_g1_i1.p2 TRINITY_DN2084_c0_g1~~TRINITY_DN2084_c0_g1_i1.p2  ORF type:complete len:451 (+),score=73.00 TRINITY_DN2084_c0_g1_i1:1725-3077(+)